jgi:predicted permease
LHLLHIDTRALLVAITLGGTATLIAGLLPAWAATRGAQTLAGGWLARSSTETSGARFLTRTLLVAEVTLACTLCISAGLLARSFLNLSQMDRGFDPHGLMTVMVSFNVPKAGRAPVASAVDDQLRGLPGVQQLVWSEGAPMNGVQTDHYQYQPDTPGSSSVKLDLQDFFVSPDFFSMYGIPILKGRGFVPGDSEATVIIGERIAAALWPQSDPIGHVFSGGGSTFQVIGVAKEPRRPLLSSDAWLNYPTLYRPFIPGSSYATVTIQCRTSCPSEGLVRQRLLAIGPALRHVDVQFLESADQQDLAQPRATAAVGAIFASVALMAAGGGLFSVLQYAVGRRRREFGIRRALGSSPLAIGRLVFRDGAIVIATGISCGVLLAWLLAKWLASLVYGVTAADPVTWVFVVGTLACGGLAASWWPARFAMRVNPVELLREE